MARPRYCSVEGCDAEADVLITFLETGSTLDLCNEHFAVLCSQSAAELGMVWPAEGSDHGDVAPTTESQPKTRKARRSAPQPAPADVADEPNDRSADESTDRTAPIDER